MSDKPDSIFLYNMHKQEKNITWLPFNLNQSPSLDGNLELEGNMDIKNLSLFYKQKITLLENQNSFLLNQNNFYNAKLIKIIKLY